MPITLNGTTGVVTPGATVGSITGILKATSGVISQAVAGSDYGQLTLATAQTASGTAIDFTGIPSWAKRITVMFDMVSLTGTDSLLVQLGDSGGIENTGYNSWSIQVSTTPATGAVTSTSGFIVYSSNNPDVASGAMSINLVNGNTWVSFGSASSSSNKGYSFAGGKQLSSTLDSIRITRSGTNTFDAGTINISYE
jgi:hypothetical protein